MWFRGWFWLAPLPALWNSSGRHSLENAADRKQLFRMTEALADTVIERHRSRLYGHARRITIDLDPTDDPTHGEQQLSFFNGHYDTWCYLPGFLTFNEEREQFLFTAILRPGNAPGARGALGILRRLIPRLRAAFSGSDSAGTDRWRVDVAGGITLRNPRASV
jgi:hypothetical protein